MPLDVSAVGSETPPVTVAWEAGDAILYALGVGAGQDDPNADLSYTTENSRGLPQQVLPTFGAIVLGFRPPADGSARPRLDFGTFDPSRIVHAEESITSRTPLPASGLMTVTTRIVGIFDKSSGALVVTESHGTLAGDTSGKAAVVTRSSIFIRGEGGVGPKQPRTTWELPNRPSDLSIAAETRPDQALLYRRSGDLNPLHSDPTFAACAGFSRPILHGMCTYGVVARVLLRELAGGDPARFRQMNGRFSNPVYPGDRLLISAWSSGDVVQFQVAGPRGEIVLDRGSFTFARES